MKKKILEYLRNIDRPVSPHKISQNLGLKQHTVRARLFELTKNGKVTRVGPSLYTIDPSIGVGRPPLIQNFQAIVHPNPRLTKPSMEKLVSLNLLQKIGTEYHYLYTFQGPPDGPEGLVKLGLTFGVKRNKINWTMSAPLGLTYYGFMFAYGLVDVILVTRGWNIRDSPDDRQSADFKHPNFWLVLKGDLLDDKLGVRIEGANCITLYDFRGNLEKLYNKTYGVRKEVHFNEPRPLTELMALWQGGLPNFMVAQSVYDMARNVERNTETLKHLYSNQRELTKATNQVLSALFKVLDKINEKNFSK